MPGRALDLVLDVQLHVIGEVRRVVAGIVRGERDDAEDVGVRLEDRDAVLAHRVRQLRLGQLHRVLHVDRRQILAPGHVEVDLQAHRPVARVGRRVVEQALQPRELRLDRRRHRLGDVLGGGAGERRLHLHRGRRDLRIARDRQQPDREHTEQGDDDADDDREDRPPDEEIVDVVVAPLGACSWVVMWFPRGFHVAARSSANRGGFLRARPAALSASGTGRDRPAGRGLLHPVHDHPVAGRQTLVDDPEVAAPRPGLHVAGDDRVALADHVDELAAERLLHRPLRNGERAVAGEAVEPDLHELAGHQEVVGVVEQRRGIPACRWRRRATAPRSRAGRSAAAPCRRAA